MAQGAVHAVACSEGTSSSDSPSTVNDNTVDGVPGEHFIHFVARSPDDLRVIERSHFDHRDVDQPYTQGCCTFLVLTEVNAEGAQFGLVQKTDNQGYSMHVLQLLQIGLQGTLVHLPVASFHALSWCSCEAKSRQNRKRVR
jgi:hypothetical protein